MALSAAGDAATRARVSYQLTALTPAGNQVLEALTSPHYEDMLQEWRELILRSLRGGPSDAS